SLASMSRAALWFYLKVVSLAGRKVPEVLCCHGSSLSNRNYERSDLSTDMVNRLPTLR
ncbi:MAG: hypothetical protein RLY14_3494, partial [Planctomycetota bacterium]